MISDALAIRLARRQSDAQMKVSVRGSLLKIERSLELIDELEKRFDKFFSSRPVGLVIERDVSTGDRIAKVRLTEPMPETLPCIVGDAVSNIRSSLELLAVDLCKIKTGKLQKVYFPIYESKSKFDAAIAKQLPHIFHQECINILEELRPYKSGNDLLWYIHNARIDDYHNFILPVDPSTAIRSFRNAKITKAKVGLILGGSTRLDEGIPISNLGTEGTIELLPSAGPNLEVSPYLVFGDFECLQGKPVIRTLNEMVELVRSIVARFSDVDFP